MRFSPAAHLPACCQSAHSSACSSVCFAWSWMFCFWRYSMIQHTLCWCMFSGLTSQGSSHTAACSSIWPISLEERFWDWGIDYRVVFWILHFVSKDYLYWWIDRSCILISCYFLNPMHSFWLLSARTIELFLRLVYAMFVIYLTLIWYMQCLLFT